MSTALKLVARAVWTTVAKGANGVAGQTGDFVEEGAEKRLKSR